MRSVEIYQAPDLGFARETSGRRIKPRGNPLVRGKFLFEGDNKLYIRGVTYGTFRPGEQGVQFPAQHLVDQDFTEMAKCGINAVRVYTCPPAWLLDMAWSHGLYVMIGLPWEQHIAFLDRRGLPGAIEQRIRREVRLSAGHPAVLCYVVGNEIPAPIVRWHGPRRIERFIHRLYRAVRGEAPESLVTYVNYPTTEYLDLPFLDFLCFNVYLERPEMLDAYIAQLQNLAGDRPLIMTEIGLDSRRHGRELQAETLEWQIRTIFAAGCAGVFIFAWTDEWFRGGYEIDDWDFGLTDRKRDPKPALASVREAFADVPFSARIQWPKISVVVCTHNGAATLRDCLEGLQRLEYPDYEVIVVDDGSEDESAAIAQEYPVRLVRTPNRGLGSARNTGMAAARGGIIAYTDDDARPDPHWLHYLAWTFLNTDYVGVGGPNIAPPHDGPIAECVANAPGGPLHVLITHRDAEHIPGCNCAFRKDELMALGGFDPRFRAAGDDVDICWRILEKSARIGFHPGAMVWHHRRSSLRAYWKQQRGYGYAEALLERKWPSKYDSFGHIMWVGRLYGKGLTQTLRRWRIYHGFWGSAPFQRLYTTPPGMLAALPLVPEWYLLNLALVALLVVSPPLLVRLEAIALGLSVLPPLVYIASSVAKARLPHDRLRYRIITAVLHLVQPVARLWGRFVCGSTPGTQRAVLFGAALRRRVLRVWSEEWKAPEQWLQALEMRMQSDGIVVRRGRDFDVWDLETRGGWMGASRLKLAVEEHGAGKQMLLFHVRPRVSPRAVAVLSLMTLVLGAAFFAHNLVVGATFAGLVLLFLLRFIKDSATAAAAAYQSVERLSQSPATTIESAGQVVYLGFS